MQTFLGVLAIYISVALPAIGYMMRVERRLTRIETKLDSYSCPLQGNDNEG